MTDSFNDPEGAEAPATDGPGNLPEFSVSEISQAVKRTLEQRFDRVRVRGEISGFKRAASGHLYMALKDDQAVLDAVCWRGVAGRLGLKPEDGMEVVATGRITSYPGRSKYQLVVESLELAGEGALLKLLEDRRRKLAAEGLFDEARKKPLPFLPEVIGVVTSPTGAVIRDILHRLRDRFPRRVLVWPVLVQGEGAAEQIAAAIAGFNALDGAGGVPRPDLLIVARGGGALEDLWAFNEEVVVRAAAASAIPLISAVGHETDTTLIDYASDRRAPTPTAAAEIAVPLRRDLMTAVSELERRMLAGAGRLLDERRIQVEGLGRGLPEPQRILEELSQRLDDRGERLGNALRNLLRARAASVAHLAASLPHPRQQLAFARERLDGEGRRLDRAGRESLRAAARELRHLEAGPRLARAGAQSLAEAGRRLDTLSRVLESVSHKKVLARGFVLVHGPEGVITRRKGLKAGTLLELEFADGRTPAVAGAGKAARSVPAKGTPPTPKDPQGTLL